MKLHRLSVPMLVLGLTLLIGWRPNVQVVGTCTDVPTICAESDSLGIVVATVPDRQGRSIVCSWRTVGTGVPEFTAGGCEAKAR